MEVLGGRVQANQHGIASSAHQAYFVREQNKAGRLERDVGIEILVRQAPPE